jgi:DMSO/TMAO reductase YedYZ molybdopterin-dependent catalytic subunit
MDRTDVSAPPGISLEELQLATRNHGMPLEALVHDVTPIGLHYLLTHYDIPYVDPAAWRLVVGGRVRTPLELTLDDVRARDRVSFPATFECAGNGRAKLDPRPVSQPWILEAIGTAEWTGTPLRALLEEAGMEDDVTEVVFTGLDHGIEGEVEQDYARSLPVQDALGDDVLLAYEINGLPLPPQHGFPLRLVVPGWYGMTNVKWLGSITAIAEPFAGFYVARSYRYRQVEEEVGEPVNRMAPRSLVLPPGFPEFLTRERYVGPGPCRLEGRAWSGWGPIVRVEVSVDDGETWTDARLEEAVSPHAWHRWSLDWTPDGPGTYVVCSRATDATGRTQPMEPPWNAGGYSNNSVHQVTVHARE